MEITVSVKCADQIIRINYTDIIKYSFFRTQLSSFNTEMKHKVKTKRSPDATQVLDYYIIPQLTLECKSTILLQLLYPKESLDAYPTNYMKLGASSIFPLRSCAKYKILYKLNSKELNDDLLELFLYNNMYGFYHIIFIYHQSDLEYNRNLPLFIKNRYPRINVFEFLQNYDFVEDMIDYNFTLCKEGKIDQSLIPNLLEYIDFGLWGIHNTSYYDNHRRRQTIITLQSLIYCHQLHLIENISTDKIKKLLAFVIEDYKPDCTHKSIWYADSRSYNIILFNKFLNQIFEVFLELDKIGIINLADVGAMETYQVYDYVLKEHQKN